MLSLSDNQNWPLASPIKINTTVDVTYSQVWPIKVIRFCCVLLFARAWTNFEHHLIWATILCSPIGVSLDLVVTIKSGLHAISHSNLWPTKANEKADELKGKKKKKIIKKEKISNFSYIKNKKRRKTTEEIMNNLSTSTNTNSYAPI